MEYLWLFPFLLQHLAPLLGINFDLITGWFLLALFYCRVVYLLFSLCRVPGWAQIGVVLAAWIVISFTVSSEGDPGWNWTGKPVGLFCVHRFCNGSLMQGGVIETIGKIFINGGRGSQPAGIEFGYFVIYTKMMPMIAQYLLFFHYGDKILQGVRAAHRWLLAKLHGSEVALTVLRVLIVAAVCIYPQSPLQGPVERRLFNGPNLQRLISFVGGMAMMLALYKCGLSLRRAGETILGYFLLQLSRP